MEGGISLLDRKRETAKSLMSNASPSCCAERSRWSWRNLDNEWKYKKMRMTHKHLFMSPEENRGTLIGFPILFGATMGC